MAEKLFVLGHPVAHSKSPVMHNAAYRALGLDWEYGFADCASCEDARAFLAEDTWLGLNITMPYKPLAFDAATWRSDSALLAQGANVLARRGNELLADNTDGRGCVTYLRRCGVDFDGAHVVVCGTGPTSLSLLHAAVRSGAGEVVLAGRNREKAQKTLDEYRARLSSLDVSGGLETRLQADAYKGLEDVIRCADIILDATPLGMGADDPAPFDTGLLSTGQVVFDVVYGHGTSALLGAARAVGCRAFDGAGMLVAQALETVYDLVEWLEVDVDADAVDLFTVMANAAGFELVDCAR